MDPQHRLLHEVAWEAFEDAMVDPHSLRGTNTGIFVGSWLQDYKDIVTRAVDEDFFRAFMGTSIGSGAARLAHFFGTTGSSIATESGCSSAIVAVDMACKSLRNRDSNLALACGVNLMLTPFDNNTLNAIFSPEGRCKAFDEGANGFGRAEGCAVLLMKRLSDATRDGDNILGLVMGSAITQEGFSNSFGTPTVHCESLAMELALKDACVDPLDVSYIEAHGTGTPVGDPLEIAAITKAYSKGRKEPLVIGSVKTNVGHTESVSGLTGIIKVILSMRNKMLPPHLNLKKLNPAINLDAIPAIIPLETTPWARKGDKPRIAGVSSFGISGTDGHAIIQEPPEITQPQLLCAAVQARPLHIMKISAKSPESLEEQMATYENIFSSKVAIDLDRVRFEDFAYSANIGRATFNHRAVIIAKDFQEAVHVLNTKSFKSAEVQSSGSSLCFLFTGQGSQYPNMGAELYRSSPIFRDEFNKCDQILVKRYGIHLPEVLWGLAEDMGELSRTLYSQISIFCIEHCLFKLWESWGVKPDYVMGHSLGEFGAAVAAGILDFDDALMLVAERSRLIDSLPRGKMLVIQADKKTVDQIIGNFRQIDTGFWVDYAALNSPDQTVLAGDSYMIDEFAKYCEGRSMKTTVLDATHAFHSRHMDGMLEAYRNVAQTVKHFAAEGNCPKYVSGMEGKLIHPGSIDADYWVRHTREVVNFIDACKSIQLEGSSIFIEIGPHPVLSALTMANLEGQKITCLPSIRRRQDDWSTILDSLAKLYLSDWKGQVNWKGVDSYCRRSRVPLPFYPFNRKPVWKHLEASLPNIHPLLGKAAPTGCDHTIYENRITLKNTPFVQDHVIGNTVVFPGAAFMEMCLVGGHATVQGSFNGELVKPRRPVALQSLKIVSPLGLYDGGIYRLQTTSRLDANVEGEIRYNVSVARYDASESGGEGEWLSQATAQFLPVPSNVSKEGKHIDIQKIRSTWGNADITEFYDRLPGVGLRFGPKFRSLQSSWKNENGMLFAVNVPEDDDDRYLVHPIIADAMLQAIMLWTSKDKLDKIKLQVPVQIGEFTWLETSTLAGRYVYCGTNEGKIECILLDERGVHLAHMSGVDFIETSVKLMEGMIQKQDASMAKLWREVWRSTPGPLQCAYNFGTHGDVPFLQFGEEEKVILEGYNYPGEYERNFYSNICNQTRMYFINAMYDLGWRPQQGEPFNPEELIKLLPVPKDHFKKYIRFFLTSMVDTGMLVADHEDQSKFFFEGPPPTQDEIEKELQLVISAGDISRVEYQLITKTGRSLAKVWRGEVEPLQLLFPEDPSKPNAIQFYDAGSNFLTQSIGLVNDALFSRVLEKHYNFQMKASGATQPVLRILEVGSGTGAFSQLFLEQLERWGKPFEFHYTDISASFFSGAEKRLAKYLSHITFKKFDLEGDPFSQGFCPKYFDVILACEVLHVAKDIRRTLGNIGGLLKPQGILQIIETTIPDPRISQMFGLLEGYWGFQDLDLRPHHPTLTPQKWDGTLRGLGFDHVTCVPWYNSCHSIITAELSTQNTCTTNQIALVEPARNSWIVFYSEFQATMTDKLRERLTGVNRKVMTVKRPNTCTEERMKESMKSVFQNAKEDGVRVEGIIYLWGLVDGLNDQDQRQISLPLLSLVQEITSGFKAPPRLYVVTQGTLNVDGYEVTNPSAGTMHGMIKSFSNEVMELHLCHLDLPPNEPTNNHVDKIFCELWSLEKGNPNIAFRDHERFLPKLVHAKEVNNEPLPLPSGCDRYQLLLPSTKLISDLEFGVLEKYVLEETEVEVQIKASALNFRDVFAVLKPTAQFDDINSVGLDFAGVVTKIGGNVTHFQVGDRVIGMNLESNLSLPSHIKIVEEFLVSLPPNISLTDGVTLPAVFFTSILCLTNIAKMKRGDIILIHTASGGVGLSAIQLAKMIGAEIIATAGSRKKQNFLRALGIKHVFHSRTTEFGKRVLEVTNGRGVDIVLNSITGEGFKEASLSALAEDGRFIEMSKLNVWTPQEVKSMRPDVFYQIIDLKHLKKPEMQQLIHQLKELLSSGSIQPIPHERFDAVNVRGALCHLQKAKHIGKIVCVMPEAKVEDSKITVTTPQFSDLSTYLVTGGLGGIGFEVVKWMLKSGAKHIAIASRSPPKPEIVNQMDSWNKAGYHVEAFPVDVGNYDQCHQLFQQLKSSERGFPQLRGVMHAAGVLADAILENQNWSKFNHTYHPKVNGTWNLHHLTKELMLEYFVLFSSMVVPFGSPGQSNHAASNSFEDSLAAYRRSIGLPATSINWGNWGEVGVATEIDFPGIRPITTRQGLSILETALRTQDSHLCACHIESFTLAGKIFPSLTTYVEDKGLFGELKTDFIINSDDFWNEVDEEEDRDGKLLVFKNLIKNTLRTILKMNKDEAIDDLTDFQTLGVDSLMMLEMKNGLQNILGERMTLTANEMKDCNNTGSLADRLVSSLLGEWNHVKTTLPTIEELQELITKDGILPEHICPLEGMQTSDVTNLPNVLLTGATGTLGPYILKELSQREDIKKIVCLIRKFGKVSPAERLLRRLKAIGLDDQVDMSKVECIRGDITENRFGLSEGDYNRLADSVDAIFNSAVRAEHTAKYFVAPEGMKQDIRNVNVKSIVRILEFAVHSKLKHVFQASTILSVFTTEEEDDGSDDGDCYDLENENGCISEKWQGQDILDHLPYNMGYPLSKHISERLCQQAAERGIPCKTFRLPVVGGDSRNGRCDYRGNHIILRWLTFLKLKCIPETLTPILVIPVDHCAKLSVDVFFHPKSLSDVYNILHPRGGSEGEIVIRIADELGIQIQPVSMHEFVDKVNLVGDDSPIAPFLKLYRDDEEELFVLLEENDVIKNIIKVADESKHFFRSRKLERLLGSYVNTCESTEVAIRRDIHYLKEVGLFDKFGIK